MRTALDIVAVVPALAACRDPEAVCAVLAESTRARIGADGVTVVLRDGERCRYVEEHALGPLWKGRDFAVGECPEQAQRGKRVLLLLGQVRAEQALDFLGRLPGPAPGADGVVELLVQLLVLAPD